MSVRAIARVLRAAGVPAALALALHAAPPVQSAPAESGASVAFDPRDLPRAEPGTWAAFLDPERSEAAMAALDPEIGRLLASAQARYSRRDYPGAVEGLRRCLALAPDFPPALQLLGTALFRVQRYGDSAECLERFLVHAPGERWRTQALGHCYYSLGDYERARAHYRLVLDSLPEGGEPASLAEARRGLALAYWRLGEPEAALAELRTVVAQRPEHSEAWTWIGQIEYEDGDIEVARSALERARDLAPYEPRPWYLLSKVFFELGLEEEGEAARARWQAIDRVTQDVRSVEARLELDPRNYDLAVQLVELHKTLGNKQGVRRALAGLLHARPPDLREVDVRIFVLETLIRSKDLEGAATAAQALERACPDDPETWKHLESYYDRIGDSLRQIEAGERYLRLRAQ